MDPSDTEYSDDSSIEHGDDGDDSSTEHGNDSSTEHGNDSSTEHGDDGDDGDDSSTEHGDDGDDGDDSSSETESVDISRGPYWCPRCTIAYFDFDDVWPTCPYCLDSTDSPRQSPGSSFNPLIVLPGDGQRRYDLHYHDTAGGGLRPLPPAMTQSLLGSGLESFLNQLWDKQKPLPTVNVDAPDSICAVCTDPFAPGSEALEMPCSHRYHAGCILSWLRRRRSCPMCREELPIDTVGVLGLALWRQSRVDELVVGSFFGAGDLAVPTALYRFGWIANIDDGGGRSGIEWRPPRRSGGDWLRRFFSLFRI